MKTFILLLALLSIVGAIQSPWPALPAIKTIYTSRQCSMCRFSVALANYVLKTRRGADSVYRITNAYCKLAHMESPMVCSKVTKLFNQEVVKVLSNGVVTPRQVCGYLSNNTCGAYHDPMADWEVNLEASLHLDQKELAKIHQQLDSSKTTKSLKPYRVIHISDTHIDSSYQVGSVLNCGEPLCCRANSSLRQHEAVSPAGHWGSYGVCDIPLRTFESALKQLNKTVESDNSINYIIWTGDIQPHNVWEQNRQEALETFDIVFSKIFEYLPNVTVFPTLGNHEMVPVDSFSPSNLLSIARDDSPEWLYRRFDRYWSRWLPSSTLETITKDGFYAVTAQPGLKIISLNTNFCHNTNFWLYINSTDPGNQLQWLIHELQLSELDNEKVHIVGHIPPGSEDCLRIWSKNYNRIVRRFSRVISGQFFGHTHTGEFEVFYDKDGIDKAPKRARLRKSKRQVENESWQPISVGFIGPSITTFVGLNPGFRTYTIDPNQNFMPVDFDTYYMNLTEANLQGANHEPVWTSIGSFANMFKINDVTPRSIHSLLVKLVDELNSIESAELEGLVPLTDPVTPFGSMIARGDPKETEDLFKLYHLFNGLSDLVNRSTFDELDIGKKKEFLCRFFTSQSHNKSACKLFINHSLSFSFNEL